MARVLPRCVLLTAVLLMLLTPPCASSPSGGGGQRSSAVPPGGRSGAVSGQCAVALEGRVDCGRDRALSRADCESRGCCYEPLRPAGSTGPPWCFYPSRYPGYRMGPLQPTEKGQRATLTRSTPSYLPRDVPTLQLDVTAETRGRLRLTLKDPASPRYEVPFVTRSRAHRSTQNPLYDVHFQTDPFGFIVRRESTGRVLLNSTVGPLLFADQYLQLSSSSASAVMSGLGEHLTPLVLDLNWSSVSLWNRDMAPHEGANLYGSHPFLLVQEGDGLAHGVFLLNSNAMEVFLQPAPAVTWVTTGGILDFYFFLGPSPESVIQQYLELIGLPMMPPYWALGFHLSRWGYSSTNATRAVVQRMRQAQIPQDVQWNDLDYADSRRVFTFDPQRFGDLPQMVEDFHALGLKYVLILDPGISSTAPPGSYAPFDVGLKRGVFIRNATGQILIGKVWPGPTAFPDFTNPATQDWWMDCIREFHSRVPLDGLWIDMNEPASFVQGSVDGCPDSDLERPPYTPGVVGGQLSSGTLCPSALHHLSTHYNLHNLYGLTEAMATHRALLEVKRSRPFVLSRSSFPGLGRFSAHWTGDVRSDWEQLRFSIPAVLLFGLYGVPLVGADVCGFGGDTTEELCVRWTQLGAFYPFMRNHNDKPNAPQEPYVFSPRAQDAIRSAVLLRYALLPFLYTLLHHTHTRGGAAARPLFLEFPSDPECRSADRQFLWGRSVLISPVLEEGARELTAYLPTGTWYSLHSGQAYHSVGQYVVFPAPLDTINVHVREGSVVPQQVPGLTTAASRRNPFILTAALTAGRWARGDLFWDDGESLDTFERGDYSYLLFFAGQASVVSKPLRVSSSLHGLLLGAVRVFGVQGPPTAVWANGRKLHDFTFSSDTQVLSVSGVDLPMTSMITVQWS